MAKVYFLFFISVLVSIHLFSQDKFKAGINAGISTSQVRGDNLSGFNKAGIIAGGFVTRNLSEKWGFKMELNYIEKGSRKNPRPDKNDFESYLLRLNYLEVPLLAQWIHKNLIYEFGAGIGFLIKSSEQNQFAFSVNGVPFNKTDETFIIGLNYKLSDHFIFNCRYANSFIPVRRLEDRFYGFLPNLFNKGMYNNVLSFTLHYQI